jgi:hypothetical protein
LARFQRILSLVAATLFAVVDWFETNRRYAFVFKFLTLARYGSRELLDRGYGRPLQMIDASIVRIVIGTVKVRVVTWGR